MGKSARPQGGGRHATVTRYRTVSIPDHPLAQADGKVYKHRVVLYEKLGEGNHDCHWCSKKIGWFAERATAIVADHLDGDKWNNEPANIVAACHECNMQRERRKRTHCKNGHEFTEENTYLRPDGTGRDCLECRTASNRRAYLRRREKRNGKKQKT